MKISAIVLAAGLSRRMPECNKLLLAFNNTTIIEQVVKQLLQTSIDEVICITGFENDQIEKLFKSTENRIIFNEAFEAGLGSSIKLGVQVANADAYMICHGDMPFFKSRHYQTLIDRFSKQQGAKIVLPQCDTIWRNPVIFDNNLKPQILEIKDSLGAKSVIKANLEKTLFVDFKDASIFKDIDTMSDYQSQ